MLAMGRPIGGSAVVPAAGTEQEVETTLFSVGP